MRHERAPPPVHASSDEMTRSGGAGTPPSHTRTSRPEDRAGQDRRRPCLGGWARSPGRDLRDDILPRVPGRSKELEAGARRFLLAGQWLGVGVPDDGGSGRACGSGVRTVRLVRHVCILPDRDDRWLGARAIPCLAAADRMRATRTEPRGTTATSEHGPRFAAPDAGHGLGDQAVSGRTPPLAYGAALSGVPMGVDGATDAAHLIAMAAGREAAGGDADPSPSPQGCRAPPPLHHGVLPPTMRPASPAADVAGLHGQRRRPGTPRPLRSTLACPSRFLIAGRGTFHDP